ncbi:amidophosphoribosyltransferase 2, chloroplastic-like [Papaver somniferum]|uniref:amidophosphoribosyltransferase 2, chloroplastic-like n=1 Tax=Papaver somniferum TaxID=3469 RepID=UPI000E6FCDF0|nr:amidophosphoribosyltransferase 2, chloroplastic-like [Papaver somniferum]
MRIASPPMVASCYYGVDTPNAEELISKRLSIEETRKYIGCDLLAFLPFDSLTELLKEDSSGFCYACFTGNYPVSPERKAVKV